MISGPFIARQLSRVQCDELIAHIDTMRPVVTDDHRANATRSALVYKKLIRFEPSENLVGKPRGTVLTEFGREVVCAVLADWIENLSKPIVAEFVIQRLIRENIKTDEVRRAYGIIEKSVTSSGDVQHVARSPDRS